MAVTIAITMVVTIALTNDFHGLISNCYLMRSNKSIVTQSTYRINIISLFLNEHVFRITFFFRVQYQHTKRYQIKLSSSVHKKSFFTKHNSEGFMSHDRHEKALI